jgi:hypothetical protein
MNSTSPRPSHLRDALASGGSGLAHAVSEDAEEFIACPGGPLVRIRRDPTRPNWYVPFVIREVAGFFECSLLGEMGGVASWELTLEEAKSAVRGRLWDEYVAFRRSLGPGGEASTDIPYCLGICSMESLGWRWDADADLWRRSLGDVQAIISPGEHGFDWSLMLGFSVLANGRNLVLVRATEEIERHLREADHV